MVRGIDKFKEALIDYTDQFIIIGGTACDYVMDNIGLDFRATQDIDIVLIIEAISSDFVKEIWKFLKKGKYENWQRSTGKKQFYRFCNPQDKSYPKMIELLPEESVLTPIPADEELSSLSAILLNDDYYQFIMNNRIMIKDLPFVTAECLIPLKAKAWMDLSIRQEKGEKIDSKNIKKHKLDIIRLSQVLKAGYTISLEPSLKKDMQAFMEKYETSDITPKSIGIKMKPEDLFQRLRYYYQLDK